MILFNNSLNVSLKCPDLKKPVPCGDGTCHSDYITCLRVRTRVHLIAVTVAQQYNYNYFYRLWLTMLKISLLLPLIESDDYKWLLPSLNTACICHHNIFTHYDYYYIS